MLNYFEVLVFSFLSGNHDMHMKNFAILYRSDELVLSPAYDLINTALGFPKDNDDMAMMVSGRKRNRTVWGCTGTGAGPAQLQMIAGRPNVFCK